jgi:hypothetical protein
MPYLTRDVQQIVDEIRDNGRPYGVFIDNNLGSDPEYLRRLCRGLRPLDKIWSAAVSIDVTDDPSLVREMALAGCTGVFVGLESLRPRTLQTREKSPSPPTTRRVASSTTMGFVNGASCRLRPRPFRRFQRPWSGSKPIAWNAPRSTF